MMAVKGVLIGLITTTGIAGLVTLVVVYLSQMARARHGPLRRR